MLTCFRITVLALLILPSVAFGVAQHEEAPAAPSFDQIVSDLEHADRSRRIAGFNAYIRIPREARSPRLVQALVRSAEAENAMYRAIMTGQRPPIPWDNSHDFIGSLMTKVMELRDPATIPLIIQFVPTGAPTYRSLAAFGRLALPDLFARIDGQQPASEKIIRSVLTTLRFMVEGWGLGYFTGTERADLERVAWRFLDLRPGEYPPDDAILDWEESDAYWRRARLVRAMQLAWLLENPDLRDHVSTITTDREELRVRGLDDQAQTLVYEFYYVPLLAGEPPLPHYEPLSVSQ